MSWPSNVFIPCWLITKQRYSAPLLINGSLFYGILLKEYLMNILVISDDSFFSLGINESMKREHNVFVVDANSDFILSQLGTEIFWRVDFIFVSLASTVKFMEVMYEVNKFMARMVIFSDSRHCQGTHSSLHYHCASKRLSMQELQTILVGDNPVSDRVAALTQREEAVLLFILQGFSNTKISSKMGISVKTVSAHKLNALRKFGLKKINQFSDFSMRYHDRFRPALQSEI
jgi:DNA-binding CsgD family transcriptional regulator